MKVKCLICGKELKLSVNTDEPTTVTEAAAYPWDGAVVDLIVGNYGSKFDLTEYLVAICDNCVHDAVQWGRLLVGRNRMNDAPSARIK